MFLPQLRRVRWAVRAILVLGVAASVVANVLHARDNVISQAIAAWPPLALLLTVELISRVPVHRRYLAMCRLIATATITGIAAWVSYWHMAGVAARYGETGASPYLLPLSVDGLIVVASICLVELGGRISAVESDTATAAPATTIGTATTAGTARTAARATTAAPATTAGAAPVGATVQGGAPGGSRSGPSGPAILLPGLVPAPLGGTVAQPGHPTTDARAFTPTVTRGTRNAPPTGTTPRRAVGASAPGRSGAATGKGGQPAATRRGGSGGTGAKTRRSAAQTMALAEQIRAARPDVTDPELAAELGISVSRWRTVRREAAQPTAAPTAAADRRPDRGQPGSDLQLAA